MILCEDEVFELLEYIRQHNPLLHQKMALQITQSPDNRSLFSEHPEQLKWLALPRDIKLKLEAKRLYAARNPEGYMVLFKQNDKIYRTFSWNDACGFTILPYKKDIYAISPNYKKYDLEYFDSLMKTGLCQEVFASQPQSRQEEKSFFSRPLPPLIGSFISRLKSKNASTALAS